jgi:ABC-type multidrug transport system fused ATPase/permease subunit
VFWLLCWTPGTAPLLYIYDIVSNDPHNENSGWNGERGIIAIPTTLGPILYFALFVYLDQIYTHFKSPLYLCRKRLELGTDDLLKDLVLKVDGIVKRYGGVEVLKQVSFEIKRGQTVCLIGNNGSGKTTLINILAGFASPEEGNITVGGESILNNITAVRDSIRLCQ